MLDVVLALHPCVVCIVSGEQVVGVFFFFKQKTAYEMLRSLVGSEMCIRDSAYDRGLNNGDQRHVRIGDHHDRTEEVLCELLGYCLLYTSDAADDLLCVDLGGRRIIKKKKKNTHKY